MAQREKITVIIPSYNEEANIGACLDTVGWADEIFVVDSFSTDRTVEFAQERGARLVQHEYVNSATQKNWAIPQATHPWIMVVDADERVTPELKAEILRTLEAPVADGYDIGRENYFMGRRVRYCGWQSDTCLRLFRREAGRYEDRQVHADVIISTGKVARLKSTLRHETFRSFDQYMKKFDRYTTWAAGDRALRTPNVTWAHLALRPAGRFFKQYFLKLGVLDGKTGLIICSLAAYSVFMKYAKLWETREKEAAATNGKGGR